MKTCISQKLETKVRWLHSASAQALKTSPSQEEATLSNIISQLIFIFLHLSPWVLRGPCLSHHCYKQVLCSRSQGWLSRLPDMVDLYADMSLRINQAYQSDNRLLTCYKHLPCPSCVLSSCRLFTELMLRLLSGCGSNIGSALSLWFFH